MAKKAKAREKASSEQPDPRSNTFTNDAGDDEDKDEKVDDTEKEKLEDEKEGEITLKDEKDVEKDVKDDDAPDVKEQIEETKNEEITKEESKDSKDVAESTGKSPSITDNEKISPGDRITEPGSYDVLLGRGKPVRQRCDLCAIIMAYLVF